MTARHGRALKTLTAVLLLNACGKSSSHDNGAAKTIPWPQKDLASAGADGEWGGMGLGDKDMGESGHWKNRMWLNFEGATVKAVDSFIVANSNAAERVIPPFSPADLGTTFAAEDRGALIDRIVAAVKKAYGGVAIEIFKDKPADGKPYAVMHVGGANFTGRANVLGVSPLDVGNFSGTDILFAFPQEFQKNSSPSNETLLVHTMAHEMAHSLGGRHIKSDRALMNPVVGESADQFDVDAPLDAAEGSENTYKVLAMNVGRADASQAPTSIPELKDLTIESEGEICQLSVFNGETQKANPDHVLTQFTYAWDFAGIKANGPTVRFRAKGVRQFDVAVTVTNPAGDQKVFRFKVDKPR